MFRDANAGSELPFGSMDTDGAAGFSLKSVAIHGEIHGMVFTSSIRQIYRNDTDQPIEAIYTFPVAWDTALLGLNATIGEKSLVGKVIEKNDAENRYEQAVSDGDSAIMVQASARGLYTANLGNIGVGESVTVEIQSARLLVFEQGRIRLCIPTVIGQRYGISHGSGRLAGHESAAVSTEARYPFSLRLSLYGDMAEWEVSCPSHTIASHKSEKRTEIKLQENAWLDRDFVLLLKGAARDCSAQYVSVGNEIMMLASFAPCLPQGNSPIGLKILVDCSGSMSGPRIAQAQQAVRQIASSLTEQDWFSYSRFGSKVIHLFHSLQPCTPEMLRKLHHQISVTDADMGGTEMAQALVSTCDIRNPENMPQAVLLITDGDIWDIEEVIQVAKKSGHRIFVIGVGMTPSESLLRTMAEKTGGACELVTPQESMNEAIVRMFHRMKGNIARNVRIDWGTNTEWRSALPRFIYNGETVHLFAAMRQKSAIPPVLYWEADGEDYMLQAAEILESNFQDLFRLGKFKQMNESQNSVVQKNIALKYQLVSQHTALLLVHERCEKLQGLPSVRNVPQMVAAGSVMSCYSVFDEDDFEMPSFKNFAMNVDAKYANAISDMKDTANRLHNIWMIHRFSINSVLEFIENYVYTDTQYEQLKSFISNYEIKSGIEQIALWALLLEWISSEIPEEVDRHSKRLFKSALLGLTSEECSQTYEYFSNNIS